MYCKRVRIDRKPWADFGGVLVAELGARATASESRRKDDLWARLPDNCADRAGAACTEPH